MWFYMNRGVQSGPIPEGEVDGLIRERSIGADTLVWREGLSEWTPAARTELRERLDLPVRSASGSAAPPPAPVPAHRAARFGSDAPERDAQAIATYFTTWWIATLAGIALSLMVIGVVGLIVGVIAHVMLLHRMWCVVQDGEARTSPGKAVGFMFIPLFNLYWFFVAYLGLSEEMNRLIEKDDLAVAKASEGLARTHCVLLLLSLIPYLGMVIAIAALVVAFLNLKQLRDTAIGILKTRSV